MITIAHLISLGIKYPGVRLKNYDNLISERVGSKCDCGVGCVIF